VIEASDLARVNKTDLYSPDEIQATTLALRSINPDIEVRQCVRCEADSEVESDIYRLKGYLSTGTGTVYVDYTKGGLSISRSPFPRPPVIVLIHAGQPQERTREFIRWLGIGF